MVGVARVVELAGVAILLVGALIALAIFGTRIARRLDFAGAYHSLRADLGRAILLGLEFLVIADIIGTGAGGQWAMALGAGHCASAT